MQNCGNLCGFLEQVVVRRQICRNVAACVYRCRILCERAGCCASVVAWWPIHGHLAHRHAQDGSTAAGCSLRPGTPPAARAGTGARAAASCGCSWLSACFVSNPQASCLQQPRSAQESLLPMARSQEYPTDVHFSGLCRVMTSPRSDSWHMARLLPAWVFPLSVPVLQASFSLSVRKMHNSWVNQSSAWILDLFCSSLREAARSLHQHTFWPCLGHPGAPGASQPGIKMRCRLEQ